MDSDGQKSKFIFSPIQNNYNLQLEEEKKALEMIHSACE